MKKIRRRPAWAVLWALALFGLISCILEGDKLAKRGSEVENELGLYGRLHDESGSRVTGAKVVAVPASGAAGDSSRRPDAESTLTDTAGVYRFKTLDAGEYQLFGTYREGALVVLIPGVLYADTSIPQNVGIDTLRAPGQIQAGVRSGGKGLEEALCYLPGTSYLAITDDTGACLISGIPQGGYTVKYSRTGYASAEDQGIEVQSGETTTLPFKELRRDTTGNPPAPERLNAVYDTLSGTVHLTWPPVPVEDLAGYQVYRSEASGALPRLITDKLVRDTAFRDTLAPHLDVSGPTTPPKTFSYRIRSVDRGENPSLEYSPSAAITALHPALYVTAILPTDVSDFPVQLEVGDTVRQVLWFKNTLRLLREAAWYQDSGAAPIRTRSLGGRVGADTLEFIGMRTGDHVLRCVVTDETGRTAEVRIQLVVAQRNPPAGASTRIKVSIGDSVRLDGGAYAPKRGGATPAFAWDIGETGIFSPSADGRLTFKASLLPDPGYPLAVRITYSDGVRMEFPIVVEVLEDPPVPSLSAPLEAFAGDTVSLSGAGSRDSLGRIVSWEWDFGGAGLFWDASGPDVRLPIPARPGTILTVALRVTDDDGTARIDTASIRLQERNRWIRVADLRGAKGPQNELTINIMGGMAVALGYDGFKSPPLRERWTSKTLLEWTRETVISLRTTQAMYSTVFSMGGRYLVFIQGVSDECALYQSADGITWTELALPAHLMTRRFFKAVQFSNRLWVLGGVSDTGRLEDVWSTADGIQWVRATAKAAFGSRDNPELAVHAGRMWVHSGYRDDWMDDLWSSADGAQWTRVTDSASKGVKVNGQLKAHGGKLLLLDGTTRDGIYESSVLSSVDGLHWETLARSPQPGVDSGWRQYLTFQGRLWLVSTAGSMGPGLGDIWLAPF